MAIVALRGKTKTLSPRLGSRGSPNMLRGKVYRCKASCIFVFPCGKNP